MRMPTKTVIIFSESLDERDYFRNRISGLGMNAICFEKESVCFDNVKVISPKILIVRTDSRQVAWRFIFALCALELCSPLVFISDSLEIKGFLDYNINFSIHLVAMHAPADELIAIFSEIIEKSDGDGNRKQLPLFLGQNRKIRHIRSILPSIAESRDPVLLTGEKGTGKELFVRLIAKSAKTDSDLIKIDCGELSSDVPADGWLSTISNYGNGSKTITVFFKGIHLMPKQIQAEILLALEATHTWKAQSGAGHYSDVRFLTTSEVPVEPLVRNGRFRKDLYYRLNVIPVFMPPLRHRKEDIALLMDYFVINAAARGNKCITIPSQNARDTLYLYDWPGNVDELKSYMRRICMAGDESCILANKNLPKLKRKNTKEYFLNSICLDDLPKSHEIKRFLPDASELSLKHICEEFVSQTEKKLMQKALESTNWNRKKAAKLLDISYKSMLNKMKIYDII